MLRPTTSSTREDDHSSSSAAAGASPNNERLVHSKRRLQRILQRGQIFLCLSFALMTFALNMIIVAQVVKNTGRNDFPSNNISDAPILSKEVARRHKLKMRRRREQQQRWMNKRKGIQKTVLYNSSRYHHDVVDDDVEPQQETSLVRRNRKKNTNRQRIIQQPSSRYHPKAVCFHTNGCDEDLLPSFTKYSEDSIPIIRSRRRSKTQQDDDDNNEDDTFDKEDVSATTSSSSSSCRPSRSIESRTTIHPTCNDIHSIGFDDQMFDRDYSTRGEVIDLLAVGGANSVWKATSLHSGETAIFKTAKFTRQFDQDKLELYLLDAIVAGTEGNPQLDSLLQSEKSAVVTASSTSSSSSWNHIMPIYSHCHTATFAPVASGTLMDYVTSYPEEHPGETIDPLDKLRLALQVARGLYQVQMYQFGKPTFAHLDLNPSQFLMFYPQSDRSKEGQYGSRNDNNNNLPILQINDFNRGRFLHWDNQNNTCPFQFDGCDKNTRGSRWHPPNRFIGCIDVNERIDTFALGGIFFFLLSDGEAPFYNTRHFDDEIKRGEMPPLPREAADKGGDHPAYEALSEMVVRCRALRIEDRPSSLEVVRKLEEKLKKIELGSTLL